jgi:hypothetical protein
MTIQTLQPDDVTTVIERTNEAVLHYQRQSVPFLVVEANVKLARYLASHAKNAGWYMLHGIVVVVVVSNLEDGND